MTEIAPNPNLDKILSTPGTEVRRLPTPIHHPTSFHYSWDSYEFSLTAAENRPAEARNGNQCLLFSVSEAVTILSMSPAAAKDLSILMSRGIAEYERVWGVIETEFTRAAPSS